MKMPTTLQTALGVYDVVRQIGQGNSGVVYEVRNDRDKAFAAKCLFAPASSEKLRRFQNEVAFLVRFRHDNVVPVLDHGLLDDNGMMPFYIMPLYGSTLRELIGGPQASEKKLEYFTQILRGVHAVHKKGVWHRDLKPENILYDRDRDELAVADFGIAHLTEDTLVTAVETKDADKLANFRYASPEQRDPRRRREVDRRADIYALGLMLNEIFTGEVLQGPGYKRVESVASEVAHVDSIVDQMCQQAPQARPESVSEVLLLLGVQLNEHSTQEFTAMDTATSALLSVGEILIQPGKTADPFVLESFGERTFLSMRGRIHFPHEAGAADLMQVKVNDVILSAEDLVNKSVVHEIGDGRQFPWFSDETQSWRLPFSPDFKSNYAHPRYRVVSGDPYMFVFDLSRIPLNAEMKYVATITHNAREGHEAFKNAIAVRDVVTY